MQDLNLIYGAATLDVCRTEPSSFPPCLGPVLLQGAAAVSTGLAGLFGVANRALSKATSSFIGQVGENESRAQRCAQLSTCSTHAASVGV